MNITGANVLNRRGSKRDTAIRGDLNINIVVATVADIHDVAASINIDRRDIGTRACLVINITGTVHHHHGNRIGTGGNDSIVRSKIDHVGININRATGCTNITGAECL